MNSEPATLPFRVREWVRWSDVDAAGIVCYGMYLRFFEIAESDLFRGAGLPVRTLAEEHGLWLVRRRVECEFLSPAFVDDELEIAIYAGNIGNTSVRLNFIVRRAADGVITAEASYLLVSVDKDDFQPKTVPDELRRALAPHLADREDVLRRLRAEVVGVD